MVENGVKQEHRLTTLEVNVDTILNNHLPHIQAAVDDVKEISKQTDRRSWWILGTVILGTVVGIAVQVILNIRL